MKSGDVAVIELSGEIKGGERIKDLDGKEITVVVGKGRLIPGLEEALLNMKEGDEKTVEIPPEKGYGKRNPNLVGLVPLASFKKSRINPVPGMIVNIDGRPARILSVSGGRVQVDFNHQLAGKTLIYKIKVKKVLEKDNEKVKAIANKYFKGLETEIKGNKIVIRSGENIMREKDYIKRKLELVAELLLLGKEVDWVEEFSPRK